MKKILLSLVAAVIACGAMAQNATQQPKAVNLALKAKVFIKTPVDEATRVPATGFSPRKKVQRVITNPSTMAVTRVPIATSNNGYGVLNSNTSVIDYNAATNGLVYSFRSRLNGNAIGLARSANGGTTWDSTLILNPASAETCRHPSGLIINTGNNTNFTNAYGLGVGPVAGWPKHYYLSGKLDNTGLFPRYLWKDSTAVTHTPYTSTVIEGGFAAADYAYADNAGRARISGYATSIAGSNLFSQMTGIFINTHSFVNSTSPFSWKSQHVASPNILFYGWHMAWSENGQIGYSIINGIDTLATGQAKHCKLHVYKTTNGGMNWNKLPDFDFSTIAKYRRLNGTALPTDTALLRPVVGSNNVRPLFITSRFGEDADATVDAYGNLHFISPVLGGSSPNPDSTLYAWTTKGYLFDTFTVPTGGWGATFIDSLKTDESANYFIGFPGGSADIGHDHRINASRTTDGRYVVASWTDTETELGVPTNIYPNIKAWAFDVRDRKVIDNVRNYTKDDAAYADENLWYYASHRVMTDATKIMIPGTVAKNLGNGNDLQPIQHFFVKGLDIPFANINRNGVNIPVLVNTTSVNNTGQKAFKVSAYPNPTNATTVVSVEMIKGGDATLTVSNLIGQVVHNESRKGLSVGTASFDVDASKLNAGVYFYTVNVNGETVTNKLIVE